MYVKSLNIRIDENELLSMDSNIKNLIENINIIK